MSTRSRVDAAADPRDLTGDFPHRVEVPVRVADTDTFDHVNNATYLTYFEVGRVEYLVAATGAGLPVPSFGARVSYILAEARVAFRSPARYGDILTVETRIATLGRTSLTMDHRITGPGLAANRSPQVVVAVGATVLIRYDYDQAAPVAFEPELVAQFERFEGRRLRP